MLPPHHCMASHPGSPFVLVAPLEPASRALEAVLASLDPAPSVRRVARLQDAGDVLATAALVVVDEASLAAGDAARLARLRESAASPPPMLVLLADALGPGRGLVTLGAIPLLKPVVLEELLRAATQALSATGAAPPPTPASIRDGEWIRGLADELATPLATVSGYAQLMAQEKGGEAAGTRWDAVQDGLERLRRSVESLRAAGGARRARPKRGDLSALALERAAASRSVARISSSCSQPVPALLDEPIAAQAIDATLDFVLRATQGSVALATARAGADAVVSVSAEGATLDPAIGPRLFDPYASEDPPSGLLLAEARGLVRAHGGEARCSLKDGRLELRLHFPAAPNGG